MVKTSKDIFFCFSGLGRSEASCVLPALHRLISLTDAEFSAIDIGFVNLLAGAGLPGGTGMTSEQYFRTMDIWAQIVAEKTESWRPNFRPNPTCPTDAQYRCWSLVTTLRDRFDLKHYLHPQ